MKKKLRLYCGLLTLVLVAAIVCDLVHVNYSSSTDKEREELYFGEEPGGAGGILDDRRDRGWCEEKEQTGDVHRCQCASPPLS